MRNLDTSVYRTISTAMPEIIAENKKMTGIMSEPHHSRDFSEPNTKPTYPCRPWAAGMPTIASVSIHFSSYDRAFSEVSSDHSVMAR